MRSQERNVTRKTAVSVYRGIRDRIITAEQFLSSIIEDRRRHHHHYRHKIYTFMLSFRLFGK